MVVGTIFWAYNFRYHYVYVCTLETIVSNVHRTGCGTPNGNYNKQYFIFKTDEKVNFSFGTFSSVIMREKKDFVIINYKTRKTVLTT